MRLHHCHARAYIALWRHCLTRFRHNAAHIEHPEAALIFALPYIGCYKNSLKKLREEGDSSLSLYLKLGAGLVGLIALGYGLSIARSRLTAMPVPAATQPVPVTAAEVQRQAVPIVLEGLGTVQALYTATIRTQVTGTLEEVDFTEGQKVKRGQVLAKIDPRTYQAQLDQAKAALARDQAHLANAQLNLQRYATLAQQHSAPQQQADTQRALVAQDEEIVKADQAAIEYAKTELSYTTITAPFDGVTGVRLIDPGNIVHPTDPTGLVVVTQVQPITVIFPLPSADIPDVQEALAKGEVKVDAYTANDKKELDRGRLLLIDNQADPTSGTVRLKAIFPNSAERLWPGTFVNAHIVTHSVHDGLTVPLTAVQQGPQGPYVYVIKAADGTVETRLVTIVQSRNNQVMVSKGLAAGETVVTAGQYGLTGGTRVSVVKGSEASQVQNKSTASEGMLP
jgi:membrane fusion protein, multidrug efflux system